MLNVLGTGSIQGRLCGLHQERVGLLDSIERKLHRAVMLENYSHLVSVVLCSQHDPGVHHPTDAQPFPGARVFSSQGTPLLTGLGMNLVRIQMET